MQESLRGNVSIGTRADANSKREIQYSTGIHTEKSDLDALNNIYDNYPDFAFSRNPRIHYDEVFPAYFNSPIQSPYGGFNWDDGYKLDFTIAEQ